MRPPGAPGAERIGNRAEEHQAAGGDFAIHAPAIHQALDDTLKPWRTLQARCLLARFAAELIDGDDGRPLLVVSRWALTRSFNDLQEAEQWLVQVGAA